jgi:serine protease Do
MKASLRTGLLSAGLLLPGLAVERPSNLETDLPLRAKPASGAHQAELDEPARPASEPIEPSVRPQPAPQPDQPPAREQASYLGLGVSPLPDVLAAHLGLDPLAGVIVRSVDPEGPAAAAGVQPHDVIRALDGTVVRSQTELRALTAAHSPGDFIEMTLIQKGVERTMKAQLAARPASRPVTPDALPGIAGNPLGENLDKFFDGLPPEQAERIRRAIEENLRFAQDPSAGGLLPDGQGIRELQRRMLGGALEIPDGAIQMSGTSSVRLLDGDGSVEIEVRDGAKEVRVRDRDSKILWEGPYSTEAEKAAVPAEIRSRIDRVDLNGMSGFHFRFGTEPAGPDE